MTVNKDDFSSSRARGYLEALSGQCALVDRNGEIICVNSDWEAFAEENSYHSGPEDPGFGVGRNYLEVCDSASGNCGDEAPDVASGIRSVISKEAREFVLEYPCHSPFHKRWFKVQARLLENVFSDESHVLVQHVDVTEQVVNQISSEKERIALSDKLTALIETAPIRIAVLDRDLRYRFANQAFCQGIGADMETLRQQHVDYVLHPESLAVLEPLMQKALKGEPQTCETPVTLKNGSRIDAIISYLPDNTDSARISGIYAIVQDISELKKRERDLEDARRRADGASAAKTEFLSCMSHELRTPLNAVIGFSGLLADIDDEQFQRQRVKKYANNIRDSGTNLLKMVERLLDLSAIEQGRYQLNPSRFDFKTLMDQCRRDVLPLAAERGLELRVIAPANPPELWGDPASILQVLTNLVTNSLKFTHHGHVEVKLEIKDGFYSLIVSDTGIGMSPEVVDKLKQPTTDLPKMLPLSGGRTGGESPGWGLGYSISRDLVELHGGTIALESKLGAGTRVTVRLPDQAS